jgi:hypothetical protein
MEKIMNKTNYTSNLDHGTLNDTELDAVTGGMLYLPGSLSTRNSSGGPGDIRGESTDKDHRDWSW